MLNFQVGSHSHLRICKSLWQITFHDDCREKNVEIIHKLRLYHDEDHTAPQSTKKPVSMQPAVQLLCASVIYLHAWTALCMHTVIQIVRQSRK